MVVFDGAVDPASIPEYLAWRHALLDLEIAAANPQGAIRQSVAVTPSEWHRLAPIVAKAVAAYNASNARQAKLVETVKRGERTWEEAVIELRSIELASRETILEASSAILDVLGDESRVALKAWVYERRRGVKARVPKKDVELFLRPR